jgi:hypothetical protein
MIGADSKYWAVVRKGGSAPPLTVKSQQVQALSAVAEKQVS